jgi:hypothetical protein
MTARFFITIDTEEDNWGEYRSTELSVEGVLRLRSVQEIFDRYGAIPTYLITYPVVKDESARALFLELLAKNRCEIGAHCHPWNTPPFEEVINERHSMLCNLPPSTVLKKIAVLQNEITQSLGLVPRTFRAGRWGFGADVAAAIHSLGFRVDTSVTPFIDWSVYTGPDYRHAPTHPYRFNPQSILSAVPNGVLLEVPATIGFLQQDEALCRRALQWASMAPLLRIRGILDKARILNLRWLSPELSNARDMIALVERTLRRGSSYLNMAFHSTTLLPGKTPFVQTQRDLDVFLHSIEAVV